MTTISVINSVTNKHHFKKNFSPNLFEEFSEKKDAFRCDVMRSDEFVIFSTIFLFKGLLKSFEGIKTK